jgi:fructokinase
MVKKAISFGEMLWDVFPNATVPGGATLNVAMRLSSLGITTRMISAVGKEAEGQQLVAIMRNQGVDTTLIREHEKLETGKVYVTLDEKGNGSYTITDPAAWDEIHITEQMAKATAEADAFIFGSMSSRHPISRNTLKQLLEIARFKVFDINLRPPYYSFPTIDNLFQKSDLVKLNDEELKIYCKYLGEESDEIEYLMEFISELNKSAVLCVTLAEKGAVLLHDNTFTHHPGYKVKVADTVGAGDGFLAGLISRYLSGDSWPEALAYACALGALVASKPTANPPVTENEIRNLMRSA